MKAKLTIDGRLESLNEYIGACRTNPHRGAKFKKDSEDFIFRSSDMEYLPLFRKPVFIAFVWYEPHGRRDPDNVTSYGRKVILDSLVSRGILADDGQREIAGFSDEWFVDRANPRIEVTIEEVG